jgi:hypothetical protein
MTAQLCGDLLSGHSRCSRDRSTASNTISFHTLPFRTPYCAKSIIIFRQEITIVQGIIMDNTEGFLTFRNQNLIQWGTINQIVQQISQFCRDYGGTL